MGSKFINERTKETVISVDRRGLPSEGDQSPTPDWLMMRTLPDEPKNLDIFKPDAPEESTMNRYTEMPEPFEGQKPGEVNQGDPNFYMAIRESGDVNDDYIHPVSTQDEVPEFLKADNNDDESDQQGRVPSYLLPESC
ncbi:uncharacterized protein [Ptychodera flava]|uniref:uncharacterized protein n=1 Tax=Ptychodera flava TaxID=63121 RepID=UPI003969CD9E